MGGNPCTQTHQGSSSKGTRLVVLLPHSNPHPGSVPSPHVWPALQVPDGHSTSYPSLLSHLTSTSLNAPALALPVAKRQPPDPGLRSFHPLASSPPCDFHLLNLRTLQAEVSILLHPMLSGPKSGLSSPDSFLSQGLFLDNTFVLSSPRTIPCPRQKPHSSYTARVLTVALRPRTWASTAPQAKAR